VDLRAETWFHAVFVAVPPGNKNLREDKKEEKKKQKEK